MDPLERKVVITCYAKINLFLDVVCKRPDGYHNIETIFQTISLGDLLEIELLPSETIITCDNLSVPCDETNLAFRAFHTLARIAGYTGGIRIHIEKNIPVGSGLGGGSSNAAATLVALNHLLQTGMSEAHLHEAARELGADVPFLISGGTAAAWQKGDRFTRLPPPPESFAVVAVPRDLAVSTADAYGLLKTEDCRGPMPENLPDCSERLRTVVASLNSPAPLSANEAIGSILYNAFEKPILARYPEIAELKTSFHAAGAKGALMSGSGSAVFALADSLTQAHDIRASVEKSTDGACFIVRTIDTGWKWKSE